MKLNWTVGSVLLLGWAWVGVTVAKLLGAVDIGWFALLAPAAAIGTLNLLALLIFGSAWMWWNVRGSKWE